MQWSLDEIRVVSGGIQQPWVVLGALHAGVEGRGLAVAALEGSLLGEQDAGVGQGAVRLPGYVTLLLPLGEVAAQVVDLGGCLHPLDHLEHRHEVDVLLTRFLADEVDEYVFKAFEFLQP